ncbi:MAG TPA: vitamin B12 dependent-methionine synthase activation domain-containing protein, partial [Planctomycetaceae bacterium]|nr:vitamin B12 dependent-methionine synthase activation domain-containing protein [Planctomycetaceae bacterium]
GSLVDDHLKPGFDARNRASQERDRAAFAERQQKTLVPYAEACRRKFATDWQTAVIDVPAFLGRKVLKDFPLEEIVPYVDWSPFFQTWELKGKYPAILRDPAVGEEASKLFADAKRLLNEIVEKKLLRANGVYGFWPVNAVGDDIQVYAPSAPRPSSAPLARFHTLRQQWERKGTTDFYALADFIAPVESGRIDYLGAFAVTTGLGIEAVLEKFHKDHDDYSSIMTKALADRLAEAFAELLHARVRREWGFGQTENLTSEDLIEEKYRGIRPAPGYPACPDHTEKRILFDLLEAEQATGIQLTESFAMYPAASVSGLYFAHPQSRYFAVDRVTKDQVEAYAARKSMPVSEVERWLAPNLGYEP